MRTETDLPFADLLKLSTMTLATSDQQGNPHAAPVYFVSLDINQPLKLYFFSEQDSKHAQHIARNPITAAARRRIQGWFCMFVMNSFIVMYG